MKGDLLELADEGKFDVIAHGCNCLGIMGAGIAAQIANKYPVVAKKDKEHSNSIFRKEDMLGTNLTVFYQKPVIVNCYTQLLPGKQFDYAAFEVCMKKLKVAFRPEYNIGIPQIGCGIAGGNWQIVLRILEEIFTDRDITVVIYEPKIKNRIYPNAGKF